MDHFFFSLTFPIGPSSYWIGSASMSTEDPPPFDEAIGGEGGRVKPQPVTYRDWLRSQVEAEGYWFQEIDLGDGVVTPGWSKPLTEKLPFFGLPDDMSGMRVLDIGCCEGFFSFEAERRGASEVVAIDSFPESIRRFNLCRSALASRANGYLASVYDLNPTNFGTFDLVMYFGVLYHLRNPLLSLQKIASVATGTLLMQTRSFEAAGLGDISAAQFYPFGLQSGTPDNPIFDLSVIWVPNGACVRDMLLHVGFVNIEPVGSPPPKSTEPKVVAGRLKSSVKKRLTHSNEPTMGAMPSVAIFRAEAPVRAAGRAPLPPHVSGTDGTFTGASRL
jgi:tRNA (mo5U34)-methyltransferase